VENVKINPHRSRFHDTPIHHSALHLVIIKKLKGIIYSRN